MSGSSGSPVTTQTQSRDPWIGAQPYLTQMYSQAQLNYLNNQGYQPYAGPTVASIDPQLQAGLTGYFNQASQQAATGIPGLAQAQQLGSDIISQQGITPGISSAIGGIQNIAGQFPGFISGLGGAAQQYQDIYNTAQQAQNPYLLAQIADQNRLAIERVQSSMSGAGRYGSGQYQDLMARAQAEVADPILAGDYEARQNRALAATGGLGQTYNMMGGLAGQQAGLEAGIAGLYGQGLARAGQWAQAAPGFAQAQYQPYQNMMDIGQYMQSRAQQDLQGQIALYNAQQAYPWQQLEREAAILAGAGQLGGTTVTAQTPMQASLGSRLAGGALLGASLGSAIPGVGTGLGALGGAAAGSFL